MAISPIQPKKQNNRMSSGGGGWRQKRKGVGLDTIWKRGYWQYPPPPGGGDRTPLATMHKTFKRSLLKVLCILNLGPVFSGFKNKSADYLLQKWNIIKPAMNWMKCVMPNLNQTTFTCHSSGYLPVSEIILNCIFLRIVSCTGQLVSYQCNWLQHIQPTIFNNRKNDVLRK